MRHIEILETTLRDGNYKVNNKFSKQDIKSICRALDEVGFKYIEIGPGEGLSAVEERDMSFINSAKEVVVNAKIGAFYIPALGDVSLTDIAKENGLDFIRHGLSTDTYLQHLDKVSYTKNLGLQTAVNFMKSYTVSAKAFALMANDAHKAGADYVYVVDSAGGMLPEDVKAYIEESKHINPDIKLGFHGHNNLSLAMANTMQAIKSGADIVDASLRGMGRSSGNTMTEKLVLLLDRMGYENRYDLKKLFDASEHLILPYLDGKVEAPIDFVLGHSQFHSSYIDLVLNVAEIQGVDPLSLIMEYSKIDKISVDHQKLAQLASTLKKIEKEEHFEIESEVQYDADIEVQLKILMAKFEELRSKYNAKIYFNITKSYTQQQKSQLSPVVHRLDTIAFGSVEIASVAALDFFLKSLESSVDGFLVDSRLQSQINKEHTFIYDDALLYATAIYNVLKNTIKRDFPHQSVKVFVDVHADVKKFLYQFMDQLTCAWTEEIREANVLVLGQGYYKVSALQECQGLRWILLLGSKLIEPMVTETLSSVKIMKIDLKLEVFTEIIKNRNYVKHFNETFGEVEIEGKTYCSGGYVGKRGAFVVDNIHKMTKIYGVSNGDGSVKYI